MTPSRGDVIIVGGGPGGLCAAMLLQTRGFQVTVLEKQDRLGGRTGGLRLGPYVFDVGATMLAMRAVVDEMFTLAGRSRAEELNLLPVEPMYRVDFGGDALTVYADAAAMEHELHRFAAGAGDAELRAFLTQERNRFARLYPVLRRSWPAVAGLVAPSEFEAQSVARRGVGSGIDHVEGGLHQLPAAFARVAEAAGATVRRGAAVRRIVMERGRARAVELDDGQHLRADAVVVNADATHALLRMLEDAPSVRFSKRELTQQAESLSAYTLYLGLDERPPVAHHTFFASGRAGARVSIDDDLPLYACNPVVTDSTMAPRGHAALHLLALVPNLKDAAIDWFVEAPRVRERVLDLFSRRTGFDPRPHVRAEARLTPEDWDNRYELSHGAVFGPERDFEPGLAFHIPNRLSSPDNVYVTGGGAHPAVGLPGILESGRTVARLLCEAEGVAFPEAQQPSSVS